MTKDNWIKAFDDKFSGINVFRDKDGEYYPMILPKDRHEGDEYGLEDIKSFISQVEKDAIEKRTKLLEDSFKHRTKPVVNLDDKDKNCKVCGYDHEYRGEDNENAYKVAHLKVELSQAIEKTKQELMGRKDVVIDGVTYNDPPYVDYGARDKDEEISQQDIVDIINNHKCHWCNLGVWDTTETIRVLDKVIRQKVKSSLEKTNRGCDGLVPKRIKMSAKVHKIWEHGEKFNKRERLAYKRGWNESVARYWINKKAGSDSTSLSGERGISSSTNKDYITSDLLEDKKRV